MLRVSRSGGNNLPDVLMLTRLLWILYIIVSLAFRLLVVTTDN